MVEGPVRKLSPVRKLFFKLILNDNFKKPSIFSTVIKNIFINEVIVYFRYLKIGSLP